MAEVKFKINTLDKEHGIMYSKSDEFVTVSDAFAERLKKSPNWEENYEIEGIKKARKSKDDDGKVSELEGQIDQLKADVEAGNVANNEMAEKLVNYDAVLAENDQLKADVEALNTQLTELNSQLEMLKTEKLKDK